MKLTSDRAEDIHNVLSQAIVAATGLTGAIVFKAVWLVPITLVVLLFIYMSNDTNNQTEREDNTND